MTPLDPAGPAGKIGKLIRVSSPGRAGISQVELEDGRKCVWKSYSGSGRGRQWLYRIMVAREARAYRRLDGVTGIPRLYRANPALGLLLEEISGARPIALVSEQLPERFFRQTRRLLERVRRRGVLHGDVIGNVLVDSRGSPALVDFGASFVIPTWWPRFLSQRLLGLGRCYDERGVVELKFRNCPTALTAHEEAVRFSRLPLQRIVSPVQSLLQRVARSLAGFETGGKDPSVGLRKESS